MRLREANARLRICCGLFSDERFSCIGGAIGAGLFVGSGSALHTGGPGSVVICFIIIGVMLLMVMQALGELAVMYPVNGAFCSYMIRFIDPSW